MKKRSVIKNLTLGLVPASLLLLGLLLSKEALAATRPEFEVVCRAKAKDAATEMYKTCVTENKNAQIDALKKEYELKLKSMKDDYEKELSRIAGKPVAVKETSAMANSKAAVKKAKGAAAKAVKKNGKKTIVVPMQPQGPMNSAPADEVFETRAIPADDLDGSSLDIPEPIPLVVPEEQLPSEVY